MEKDMRDHEKRAEKSQGEITRSEKMPVVESPASFGIDRVRLLIKDIIIELELHQMEVKGLKRAGISKERERQLHHRFNKLNKLVAALKREIGDVPVNESPKEEYEELGDEDIIGPVDDEPNGAQEALMGHAGIDGATQRVIDPVEADNAPIPFADSDDVHHIGDKRNHVKKNKSDQLVIPRDLDAVLGPTDDRVWPELTPEEAKQAADYDANLYDSGRSKVQRMRVPEAYRQAPIHKQLGTLRILAEKNGKHPAELADLLLIIDPDQFKSSLGGLSKKDVVLMSDIASYARTIDKTPEEDVRLQKITAALFDHAVPARAKKVLASKPNADAPPSPEELKRFEPARIRLTAERMLREPHEEFFATLDMDMLQKVEQFWRLLSTDKLAEYEISKSERGHLFAQVNKEISRRLASKNEAVRPVEVVTFDTERLSVLQEVPAAYPLQATVRIKDGRVIARGFLDQGGDQKQGTLIHPKLFSRRLEELLRAGSVTPEVASTYGVARRNQTKNRFEWKKREPKDPAECLLQVLMEETLKPAEEHLFVSMVTLLNRENTQELITDFINQEITQRQLSLGREASEAVLRLQHFATKEVQPIVETRRPVKREIVLRQMLQQTPLTLEEKSLLGFDVRLLAICDTVIDKALDVTSVTLRMLRPALVRYRSELAREVSQSTPRSRVTSSISRVISFFRGRPPVTPLSAVEHLLSALDSEPSFSRGSSKVA